MLTKNVDALNKAIEVKSKKVKRGTADREKEAVLARVDHTKVLEYELH